jgi:hypothetical protein
VQLHHRGLCYYYANTTTTALGGWNRVVIVVALHLLHKGFNVVRKLHGSVLSLIRVEDVVTKVASANFNLKIQGFSDKEFHEVHKKYVQNSLQDIGKSGH